MRIVVTNDDGIQSPGLHALARAAAELGHDVVIVAPDGERSGAAASIVGLMPGEKLQVARHVLEAEPGLEAYAVRGTPAVCVLAACAGAFGEPPDLVLSGINPGANTGHVIIHSGTVGAALTALTFDVDAIAVSLQWSRDHDWHWDTAASIATRVLTEVREERKGAVLNLNVPALPLEEVRGIRWASLDRIGRVRAAVSDSEGDLQVELRAERGESEPDSDNALLDAGYATLTRLEGICASTAHAEGVVHLEIATAEGAPDARTTPTASATVPLNPDHT